MLVPWHRTLAPSTVSTPARQAVHCPMPIVVQKYGGSSVADVDKMRRVAERDLGARPSFFAAPEVDENSQQARLRDGRVE